VKGLEKELFYFLEPRRIPMYNGLNRTVTCDSCGKLIPAKAYSISSAKKVVEADGWKYSGLGTFTCPKCKSTSKK
jgi:hypothetical protein